MRGKRRRREGSRKPRKEGDVERGDGEREFEADRRFPGTERQTGTEGQNPWIGTGWGGGRNPLGGHQDIQDRRGAKKSGKKSRK